VLNSLVYEPPWARTAVDDLLGVFGEDLFMTKTVNETMWGFHDPALINMHKLVPNWFYTDFVGYFVGVSTMIISNKNK
jgi:hypothetical protein